MDPVLLILSGLLLATLIAFLAGFFPYPFGVLVLALLITARILHLRSGRGGPH